MLNLEVWDVTGNKRVTVEVPEDVPVERIMVVLVDRLMLPKYSPQGDFMSYKFHHRRLGIQLFDDQSLSQQQVVDGDVLTDRIQEVVTPQQFAEGDERCSRRDMHGVLSLVLTKLHIAYHGHVA